MSGNRRHPSKGLHFMNIFVTLGYLRQLWFIEVPTILTYTVKLTLRK